MSRRAESVRPKVGALCSFEAPIRISHAQSRTVLVSAFRASLVAWFIVVGLREVGINGVGIEEAGGSGVFLGGGTISGNSFDGVRVLAASEAIFSGPTISANGGLVSRWKTALSRPSLRSAVTGSLSGLDVDCEPQFSDHALCRQDGWYYKLR